MITQMSKLSAATKSETPSANGWARDRRHGQRPHRPCLCLDDLLVLVAAGYRQEILRMLADGPRCVTEIAEGLHVEIRIVSHQLAKLQEAGLICCKRTKSFRIYSLTDRVRALRKGRQIQIVVITEMRHWALIHIDEGSDGEPPVPPPGVFVDGEALRKMLEPARSQQQTKHGRTE